MFSRVEIGDTNKKCVTHGMFNAIGFPQSAEKAVRSHPLGKLVVKTILNSYLRVAGIKLKEG